MSGDAVPLVPLQQKKEGPLIENRDWFLLVPGDAKITYQGLVSYDSAGTASASMLYPAPNVGGFVAAIITHGLLVDSAKDKQKQKLQEAADTVLVPYKTTFDNFGYRELMAMSIQKTSRKAKGKLADALPDGAGGRVVESAPIFTLTQDQRAIIVDNDISIRMLGSSTETAYRKSIRVVSPVIDNTNPVEYWTANNGKRFKEASALLVGESFNIALVEAMSGMYPENIPFRTIRYREGLLERIERAQVIREQCRRYLIRTLRGGVMSVPAVLVNETASSLAQCTNSPNEWN